MSLASLELAIPRVLGKVIREPSRIDSVQLWTSQGPSSFVSRGPQHILCRIGIGIQPRREVGRFLKGQLKTIVGHVIALEDIGVRVDTASKVGRIYASEDVRPPRVAAHAEELRIRERHHV